MGYTFYYNFGDKKGLEKTLLSLLTCVDGSNWQEFIADDSINFINLISEIRHQKTLWFNETDEIKKKEYKESYDKLKRKLPCFLPSMISSGNHHIDNFVEYNNVISIDVDNLNLDRLNELRSLLNKQKTCMFYYVSPAGMGMKIFYQLDCPQDKLKDKDYVMAYHLKAFEHFRKEFKANGYEIDEACKNIGRVCYLSYDTQYKIMNKPKIYSMKITENELIKTKKYNTTSSGKDFLLEELYDFCINNKGIKSMEWFEDYNKWFMFGNMLVKYLKNEDLIKIYFHKLSSLSAKYNEKNSEIKINNWIKTNNPDKTINIGLFIDNFIKEGFVVDKETMYKIQINNNDIPGIFELENISIIEDKYNLKKFVSSNGTTYELNDRKVNTLYNTFKEKYFQKLNFNDFFRYFDDERYVQVVDFFLKDLEKYKTEEVTDWYNFTSCLTVDFPDQDFFSKCLMFWMFGVFNNVFTDNYFKYIFILKGESEKGKTYVITKLIEVFKKYCCYDFMWKSDQKDNLMKLHSYIFICDDELSATSKADIENVKKITSKLTVDYRSPYNKMDDTHKRIASFIGTSNSDAIYADDTRANRFICFELLDVNRDLLKKVNMEKVWGFAYDCWKKGLNIEMDMNELKRLNESSRIISIEEQIIDEYLISSTTNIMKSYDIYYFVQSKVKQNVYMNKIGSILKNKFSKKRKADGVYYCCEFKKIQFTKEDFLLLSDKDRKLFCETNNITEDEIMYVCSPNEVKKETYLHTLFPTGDVNT